MLAYISIKANVAGRRAWRYLLAQVLVSIGEAVDAVAMPLASLVLPTVVGVISALRDNSRHEPLLLGDTSHQEVKPLSVQLPRLDAVHDEQLHSIMACVSPAAQ